MNTLERLRAGVGDTVVVYLDYAALKDKGPHTTKILDIKPRYSAYGGRTPEPLVKAVIQGECRGFDASFVKSVVERVQYVREPRNIFKDAARCGMVEERGSLWTGTLLQLTILALSKLPYSFERSLNMEKVKQLYSKELAGCKKRELFGHFYTVDRYSFTSWVRRNHTKLFMTVAELEKFETKMDEQWMRNIEDDLEEMFEEDPVIDEGADPDDMSDLDLLYDPLWD